MNETRIPYADATWNPVTGCSPASPACDHCWARRLAEGRLRGRAGYPADDPFRPGLLHAGRLGDPAKVKTPKVVAVCLMGDLFHEQVTIEARRAAFDAMAAADHHRYLLLTKRPAAAAAWTEYMERDIGQRVGDHIWIGASVWNQSSGDWAVEALRGACVTHTWLSYEPALGPLDISGWAAEDLPDWIVAGCESGPDRRPDDLDWYRRLRDQCAERGVPFYLKQIQDGPGRRVVERPTLDGRRWLQVGAL